MKTENVDERLNSIKRKKRFLSMLSFLLTLGPIIVFCCIGIFNNSIHVSNKLVLTSTIIIALFLTIINSIKKYNLRSPFFIVLLGLYVVLKEVVPFMIVLSCCVIIDEFLVTPNIKKLNNRILIRDEMGR